MKDSNWALIFGFLSLVMMIFAVAATGVVHDQKTQIESLQGRLTKQAVELKTLREESIKNYGTMVNDLNLDAQFLELQRTAFGAMCGVARNSQFSEGIQRMADDNRTSAEEYQADKEALLRKAEAK